MYKSAAKPARASNIGPSSAAITARSCNRVHNSMDRSSHGRARVSRVNHHKAAVHGERSNNSRARIGMRGMQRVDFALHLFGPCHIERREIIFQLLARGSAENHARHPRARLAEFERQSFGR